MGRRRKIAGGSKAPTKAKKPKRSPEKLLAKKTNDSEESCVSQDDTQTLPTTFGQETCAEETLTEPLQNETLQATSTAIVHKKFGKLRCLVEADGLGNVEAEELMLGEEIDTTLGDETEVMWEEEVVEETVICEDMDIEVEDARSREGRHTNEEGDGQCSGFVQETDECRNLELVDVPVVPQLASSHHEIFIAEDIEFSNSPEKDAELDLLASDKVYYCESEGTSKDEDSQGSQNLSSVSTEIFATEIGVSKLRIGDVAFLDNNVSVGLHETVVCQTSIAKSLIQEVNDHVCSQSIETSRVEDIVGTETDSHIAQIKGKMCTRSSKKIAKDQISAIVHLDVTESVKAPMDISLDVGCDSGDLNKDLKADNLEKQIEEIPSNRPHDVSIIEQGTEVYKDEVIGQPLLVPDAVQQKQDNGGEEIGEVQGDVQVSDNLLKKTDDQEIENKQTITPTFRSRSGSTDTTGSESSSNCSSGIRRSSRIRSISVLKQRTRSRFEAVSTSNDLKVAESRDSSDGNSGTETQSDKESSSIKVPAPMSIQGSVSSSGSSKHLDFKPVKVKSRWRRSSELEMGGNRSSDSDVAVTPPTSSCVSPHLVSSRSSTVSPQFGVVSMPLLLTASQSSEVVTEDSKEGHVSPKKETQCEFEQELLEDKEMEERLRQFEHLKENDYLTERTICKEAKRMVCDCFLTKEEVLRGELGCGEDCLNRLLMIECGSRCTLGERCTNKHFQKQEYSTCEVFRTEKKGFGLRAIEDLPSGSFIMEYVGEVLNPKEFRKRAKDYSKDKNRHYYFMALKSDSIIDATMKGNISRFINHSCDPNSETQKWTVNGELRIGFFTSKNVSAGSEITFDYQFQRYGKEAQRCYCESPLCRGWIGEDPEKENEKPERKGRKEREEREVKKKRTEKKQVEEEYLDDIDLEEEIEKLCATGLKNRAHTVTLCRLMVRGRDTQTRVQLLQLIQRGEPACRRLFLDYHGLKLIASWVADDGVDNALMLHIEILKTLSKLPIPNKTMLHDGKVLSFVEKWSALQTNDSLTSISSSSMPSAEQEVKPEHEESEENKMCEEEEALNGTSVEMDKTTETDGSEVNTTKEEAPKDENDMKEPALHDLAMALLAEWSSLKEEFRIPKKERIEQMKEHEREADRGYKEYLDKEGTPDKQPYDSRWRQRSSDYDKRDRKKIKESPEAEKVRKSRFDDRGPKLTKQERRQLFALKVAQEEEVERQRQQHEDLWRSHEEQCLQIGLDPATTLAFDPETNQRCLFDQVTRSWQPYDCSSIEEEVHPPGYDPNNAVNEQYDPSNPANTQYDPNDPANTQYDPNDPIGGQFNPNNPTVAQYDPNNPVSSQYDPNSPVGTQYDLNNTSGIQYDSNNPQFGSNYAINTQFDPNNPMVQQYDSSNSVDSRLAPVKQETLSQTSFDPYICDNPPLPPDANNPPLPPDSGNPPLPIESTNPPLPMDAKNPPLPIGSIIPPLPMASSNQHYEEQHQQPEDIPESSDPLLTPANTGVDTDIYEDEDEEDIYLPLELVSLPPKWRSAQDDLGRTYYYHITVQIPQWQPPWDEVADTSESSEESSEEEVGEEVEEEDEEGTSSSEEEEDAEVEIRIKQEVEEEDDASDKVDIVDEEELSQMQLLKEEDMREKDILEAPPNIQREIGSGKLVFTEELTEQGLTDEGLEKGDTFEPKVQDENIAMEESNEKEETITYDQDELDIEQGVPEESPDAFEPSIDQSEPMDLEDDEDEEDNRLIDEQAPHGEYPRRDRRREGLVQERIISPRREEDRPEKKNYREIKEKLRRKKEQARKARAKKKRRDAKERSGRKLEKQEAPSAADSSSEAARKIKDNFRLQMAGAMVQYLNPYRKPDCKQGRISNTEDFKHLARKLTHFVMVKELKHCRNVDDLDCNDNVKHKARDFIKKYMSKFGPVYQRPSDDE